MEITTPSVPVRGERPSASELALNCSVFSQNIASFGMIWGFKFGVYNFSKWDDLPANREYRELYISRVKGCGLGDKRVLTKVHPEKL